MRQALLQALYLYELFQSSQQPYEAATIVIPILQIEDPDVRRD